MPLTHLVRVSVWPFVALACAACGGSSSGGSGLAQRQLVFLEQPIASYEKVTFEPHVRVAVVDVTGNPVASATFQVVLHLMLHPGGGLLSGVLATTTTGGVATFPDLSIDVAGAGYQLVASSAGLVSVSSSPFDVVPVEAMAVGVVAGSAHSAHPTADGGYVVAGEMWPPYPTGSRRGYIAKLSRDPTIEWHKKLDPGASGADAPLASVRQTADGGYIAAGGIRDPGAPLPYNDVLVIRLDAAGTELWQRRYGGPFSNVWRQPCVRETVDGGFVTCSWTSWFGGGIWIVKLDSDGEIVWQKHYGAGGPPCLELTSDGGYIVAGTTFSFGAGASDVLLLKLADDGSVSWQKTYGGAGNDTAAGVVQTADGSYVVAATTASFGTTGTAMWALKLDPVGNIVWQRAYPHSGDDEASSIAATADNHYVLYGTTSPTEQRAWALKIDDAGAVAWQRTYDFGETTWASEVHSTADGVVIAGTFRWHFDPEIPTGGLVAHTHADGTLPPLDEATAAPAVTTNAVITDPALVPVETPAASINAATVITVLAPWPVRVLVPAGC